jgi:hypothetical protein
VAIAADVDDLTASSGQGAPMSLAPGRVLTILGDEHFTAAGYRKINGSEGRELYWDITNAVDLDDIFDRCGGSSASSVYGGIRTMDHVPRFSAAPSFSIYTAFIDSPVRGEWRQGPNRYNVMVRVRRMIVHTELAA